jgi:Uma2 family endonuclease
MTAVKKPRFVTIGEYLAGEETGDVKHEYIGGTVHAMAGGTNRHNDISVSAVISLGAQLRGKSCKPCNSDVKIRIELADHTRFYYPDAMVVCSPNPGTDHFQDLPAIILEVLSDSTRRTDLGEKRDAYLSIPSLKVLLFAESDSPSVLVYRRKAGGGFTMEEYEGIESTIPLPEIDAGLPLAELYERVEFID